MDKLKKADRTFHLGGDHKAVSNWTVHLPIFINNKYGLVQAFVLRGETPMLLGRPIAKALGLSVDFLNDRMRYYDGEWHAATMGRHNEYLLPLTEDYMTLPSTSTILSLTWFLKMRRVPTSSLTISRRLSRSMSLKMRPSLTVPTSSSPSS